MNSPSHSITRIRSLNDGLLAAVALIASMALLAPSAYADSSSDELPLWELGLGATVLTVPYYRGAKDNRNLVLPVVYPIYRGDRFRIDNRGVRGELFRSQRVELDVSADAGVPGSSGDVFGRDGMSDLDPTLQFGPSLQVTLWEDAASNSELHLNLPLKGVVAVDSGLSGIGYTFSPHFTWYKRFTGMDRRWRLGVSAGLEFGSDSYHEYYYNVDEAFARAGRPAYAAEGGFAGSRYTLSLQSRHRNNTVTMFARYDSVDGAEFEDSPLVFESGGLTAGIVFVWYAARSKTMVSRDKDRDLPQ